MHDVGEIVKEDAPKSQAAYREAIHRWFELTHAQYLTIPRSVLQSMPEEWQRDFVHLLELLDDSIDWRPESGCYWVRLRDKRGRFVEDKFMDYARGRRIVSRRKNEI